MKKTKYNIGIFLAFLMLFASCQDESYELGDLIAPSNIQLTVAYIDNGTESPAPGLGSGEVKVTATADNATAYHFVIQGQTILQKSGSVSHTFTTLGTNTYAVTVVAYGTGGVSSSKSFEVEALALYEPPADLLTMLTANSSRTWRIKAEAKPHFGLGPVGGGSPFEWFSAEANDKVGTGMYDDRYTFNSNGTFTHVTNGTVFGREVLINELGGSGGTPDGADILNYVYNDYTAQWNLTAPGGVETISLSGLAFIGYYIGGNHKYIIHSRSANEMVLTSTDGNNGFNWWFTLIPE